jgi:hypothetical protein
MKCRHVLTSAIATGLEIALLTHMTAVHAELTVKDYRSVPHDNQLVSIYINAMGNGLSWANTELMVKQQAPLYCPPEAISLSAKNYFEMIDDQLSKFPAKDSAPIGAILTRALERTFPCK